MSDAARALPDPDPAPAPKSTAAAGLPSPSAAGLPPTPRPRRRRERATPRKSERTRRRLISSARQLFDRRGYRDTTIDDITRRAQVGHGTFYLYFRGKGELLRELLGQALEEFDQLASFEPSPDPDIAGLIEASLEVYERNRLLMRLLREASAADPYFREHYDQLFLGRLVAHLTESIAQTQALLGVGAPTLDPRATARAMVGLIESFAYGMYVGGESWPKEVAVTTLSELCARGIGLRHRDP
ncbi:MAG TPA: TetR/AcrR family transcriptional regulator [Candidatus Dormibacteraeota bacterium]|jgi:AcrR family transcriptional regulator|nr:TetR/AcrR family transcriptional regulator [Candidatus Dormibacteraeota bacterium]